MQATHRISFRRARAALFVLAAGLATGSAFALGLADITLQSHLGQPLRATIAMIGAESEEALRNCVKARVQTVDGGGVMTASVAPIRSGGGVALLITTAQKVLEPAVTLTVEMTCEGRTQREYSLLLDPLEWQQPDTPRAPATMPIAPAAHGVTIPAGGLPSRVVPPRPAPKAPPRPPVRPAPRAANPEAAQPARHDTAKPEAAPAPAPAPQAGAAPARAAGQTRNVLRLTTAGDAPVSQADEETAARLKAVQAKLLALETQALAVEQPAAQTAAPDPATFTGSIDQTEEKLREVQARIRALQIETKNMSAKELPQTKPVLPKPAPAVAVPVPAPQADTFLQTALAVLLAVAVAVIVALVLRMRQMKKYRDALDSF